MNKLITISTPLHSQSHFINNVGCLRYVEIDDGIENSTVITPEESGIYLDKDMHFIVGYTVMKNKKYIIIGDKK